MIRVSVAPDQSITHLVFFYAESPVGKGPAAKGSLLRTANRPELSADKLLRFRTPAGDFAQQFIKDLNDSDIIVDGDGTRTVSFQLNEEEGSSWQIWACTLTRDGVPCEPAGPWRTLVPVS